MSKFLAITLFLCALCLAHGVKTLEPLPEIFGLRANTNHYGNPSNGCMSDEVAVKIQGVDGGICAPSCSGSSCPTDVPAGCNARPQCALQDGATHKRYCAVICNHQSNCGEGASCKMIGFVGICTYDISDEVMADWPVV